MKVFFHAVVWSLFLLRIGALRPNIITIIADDLGWNDVSFHGSNQIPTPNIDALAYNGVILNSHYVPALCTPSRASFLTGKYPTSLGLQHLVILGPEPRGLPLQETLMPEYFRRQGYATHAIGKWHLGFYRKEYTPTYRGFNTHFGYWCGYQDYYDHTTQETFEPMKGYDMRRNMDVDYSSQGKYSTDVFTDEAVNIIRKHNSTKGPLFMYLAHLAPHSGNPERPFQAPDEEVAKHIHINDPARRVYAAMISRLDAGVGRVMAALRDADMLANSIVLFISDNGAATFGLHSNHGSNYPLRGVKESPWEGGVRGVAALWSPLLNVTQRVSNQILHVSDWLPTLYSAAGFDPTELGPLDGKDAWTSLSQDLDSPRTEVFHNFDEIENYSSLRVGPWKYVHGTAQGGEVDLWYGDSGDGFGYNLKKVLHSPTGVAISAYLTEKQLESSSSGNTVPEPITIETILRLREASVITCGLTANMTYSTLNNSFGHHIPAEESSPRAFDCDPLKMVCLFNLDKDPCERVNLANVLPEVVEMMEVRLRELKRSVAKPSNMDCDPFSNPSFYNNTWSNWGDLRQTPQPKVFEFYKFLIEHLSEILYLDNVLLKILFSPLLLILNEITQLFFSFVQSLLSLVIAVALVVTALIVFTAISRLIKINGSNLFSHQGISKAVCHEIT